MVQTYYVCIHKDGSMDSWLIINEGLLECLGMSAGILTTISSVPQLMQLYRTKLSRDVSLTTYSTLSMGLCMWTVYGFLCDVYSLAITSIASLIINLPIMYMKCKLKK